MRAFDQKAYIRVTVSQREVKDFARRWPCFGPCRPMSFLFDSRNGDLVDVSNDRDMDGAGVNALVDDAKAYAAEMIDGFGKGV